MSGPRRILPAALDELVSFSPYFAVLQPQPVSQQAPPEALQSQVEQTQSDPQQHGAAALVVKGARIDANKRANVFMINSLQVGDKRIG